MIGEQSILPVIFMCLMGLALLVYVTLDGFDLGVGMLLPFGSEQEKDRMVAAIGPFWDANETWLVLGVGLLLIAFPKAHGIVLTSLYLPVTIMLLGVVLRGVAFDFRVKVHADNKQRWNRAFFAGSLIASVAQGWMLGSYITGFQQGWIYTAFSLLIALALPAAYLMLGACWLIIKSENELQQRAIRWAKWAWPLLVLGIFLISIATPLASATVAERWFRMPEFLSLLPIPLMTIATLIAARVLLNSSRVKHKLRHLPFALIAIAMLWSAFGLAYSIFPYVIMDQMTIWQAASADDSLMFILWGTAITLPMIIGYTIFSYRVFTGKAQELQYG